MDDLTRISEPEAETPVEPQASAPAASTDLRERVIEVLRTCYDPEIPVNIYDLSLIHI